MRNILRKPMHLFQGPKNMTKLLVSAFLILMTTSLQAKEWAFDVFLDDKNIGTHTFKLENNTLTSQADFLVKVLFINAYEYHHTAVETWADDCLTSLKSNTTENSDQFVVNGLKQARYFSVTQNQTKQQLPACTMTFAYWNPTILKQTQLLNPQNAEYLEVAIKALGTKTISVKSQPVAAKHYSIIGALQGKQKLNIEVWYDKQDDWVQLKSTTPEGYEIFYRRNN